MIRSRTADIVYLYTFEHVFIVHLPHDMLQNRSTSLRSSLEGIWCDKSIRCRLFLLSHGKRSLAFEILRAATAVSLPIGPLQSLHGCRQAWQSVWKEYHGYHLFTHTVFDEGASALDNSEPDVDCCGKLRRPFPTYILTN